MRIVENAAVHSSHFITKELRARLSWPGYGLAARPGMRCMILVFFRAERFIHNRIFVAKSSRNQSRHRIQKHCCGEFAAGENEIADGDFVRGKMLRDAFVHSFIPAADQGG